MSDIHTTDGHRAHHGPRYSASDRPLPAPEPHRDWKARAWLWGSIIVVYALVALAIVAPATTLTALLVAGVAGAAIWTMHRLADRGARSWGADLPGPRRRRDHA